MAKMTGKQPETTEMPSKAPVPNHERLVGLRAVGEREFEVVVREVFPSGEISEKVVAKAAKPGVYLMARLQRAIAFTLLHAKAWKSWRRTT